MACVVRPMAVPSSPLHTCPSSLGTIALCISHTYPPSRSRRGMNGRRAAPVGAHPLCPKPLVCVAHTAPRCGMSVHRRPSDNQLSVSSDCRAVGGGGRDAATGPHAVLWRICRLDLATSIDTMTPYFIFCHCSSQHNVAGTSSFHTQSVPFAWTASRQIPSSSICPW